MKKTWILIPLLMAAACAETDLEDGDIEQNGIIFPEESFCNAPPVCGTTWSVDYPTDLRNGSFNPSQPFQTRSLIRTSTAGFSGGAQLITCSSTGSDIVTPAILWKQRTLPSNVQAIFTTSGVQYLPYLNGTLFGEFCSASDLSSPFKGSGRLNLTGFGSRTVPLEGTLDHIDWNDSTRVLKIYCKWRLKGAEVRINQNRPSEIIATSGGRFTRGYDLSGTPLRNACTNHANRVCVPSGSQGAGFGQCIQDNITNCVNTYSQGDPCEVSCQQTCTATSQCGGHQVCSSGCCATTPF